MKNLSLFLVLGAFLLGACERHSWEDEDVNGDGIIQESEKGTVRLYPNKNKDKEMKGEKDAQAKEEKH